MKATLERQRIEMEQQILSSILAQIQVLNPWMNLNLEDVISVQNNAIHLRNPTSSTSAYNSKVLIVNYILFSIYDNSCYFDNFVVILFNIEFDFLLFY